jgi:hypothetical protein
MWSISNPSKATDEQLSKFESELGFSLPSSYRHFLSEVGAGALDVFSIVDGVDADLQLILPVVAHRRGEQSLRDVRSVFVDRIDPVVLVIGFDSGGGCFCIGLVGADTGCVFHYDDTVEADEDGPVAVASLRKIAGSFEEFLDRVHTA